jgi:hypothetical protein
MLETDVLPKVKDYFSSLGYDLDSFRFEVPVESGHRADLTINDGASTLIIVEVKKSSEKLPTSDERNLRFDPIVRQLQTYAATLAAPFYVLTNGSDYLWFKTDESGRPSRLSEPIPAHPELGRTGRIGSNEQVIQIFAYLRDVLFRRSVIEKTDDAAILILAKLLQEYGDDELRNSLLGRRGDADGPLFIRSLNLSTNTLLSSSLAHDALWLLDQVRLREVGAAKVLRALDAVFFNNRDFHEFRIHRWLGDLLVKLGELNSDSVLLDVFSSFGDILAAAGLQKAKPYSSWGISLTVESVIWAKVQQLLVDGPKPTLFQGSILDSTQSGPTELFSNVPEPTHIISAPSFGQKIHAENLFSSLARDGVPADDLLLELALRQIKPGGRIVLLIHEGLLFSGNRAVTRKFILDNSRLVGIISLPAGALLPYSHVKASILILDSVSRSEDYPIFFAELPKYDSPDVFDSRQIPDVAALLSAFRDWEDTDVLDSRMEMWSISSSDLKIDNFTVPFNRPTDTHGLEDSLRKSFQFIDLVDLVQFIKRGRAIKLGGDATVQVIGPAAIRPMYLNFAKLDRTSSNELSDKTIRVRTGDIVINGIGNHLGSAAVVSAALDGAPISQHVLAIRVAETIVEPEYLAMALNSAYMKPQISQRATGSVMPGLTATRLEDIRVPIPDLDVQREVVRQFTQAEAAFLEAEARLRDTEITFRAFFENLFSDTIA